MMKKTIKFHSLSVFFFGAVDDAGILFYFSLEKGENLDNLPERKKELMK